MAILVDYLDGHADYLVALLEEDAAALRYLFVNYYHLTLHRLDTGRIAISFVRDSQWTR